MTIDWGEAGRIGGLGFGIVFVLLAFLSVLIWLSGKIINKFETKEAESKENKKGA
jgi:Na+-transporting methylmalonyl-CoA/oxaloacetate decarboxylase gamma subunit